MPRRIIIFVVFLVLFLTFITLNLDNRGNINFGFVKFEYVPVFHIVFISFALGLLVSLPLFWYSGKKLDNKPKEDDDILDELPILRPDEPIDALLARERFLAKRNGGKKAKNGGANAG